MSGHDTYEQNLHTSKRGIGKYCFNYRVVHLFRSHGRLQAVRFAEVY